MSLTRITVQGATTVQANPQTWAPLNNPVALSYINSIEPTFNFTALTSRVSGVARLGPRMWGSTDLPSDANGAAIVSVDAQTAGRRAGGQAGNNYQLRLRDNGGATIFGTRHFMPYGAGPLGFHIRNDNFKRDPNGDVWQSTFINGPFEFGLHQPSPAASGVSVSYIDMEILWSGSSGAFVALGVSILLPLLLPILGGANLHHINDTELAAVHHVVKKEARKAGMTSYPSIVLPDEKEKVFKELSRPTYGV